ncbi:S8 family serine peptidase [bacterium]|nr:S8 family serine peptidase [bacterium]
MLGKLRLVFWFAFLVACLAPSGEQFADGSGGSGPLSPCPECEDIAKRLAEAEKKQNDLMDEKERSMDRWNDLLKRSVKLGIEIGDTKALLEKETDPVKKDSLQKKLDKLETEDADVGKEMEALNWKIPGLTEEIYAKSKEIDNLKKELEDCEKKCKGQKPEKVTDQEEQFFTVTLSVGPCAPGSRELRISVPPGGTPVITDGRPNLFSTSGGINNPVDIPNGPVNTPPFTGDFRDPTTTSEPLGNYLDITTKDAQTFFTPNHNVFGGFTFNNPHWGPTEEFRIRPGTNKAESSSLTALIIGDDKKKEETPQDPAPEPPDEKKDQPVLTGEEGFKVTIEVIVRGQNVDEAVKDALLQIQELIPDLPNVAGSTKDSQTGHQDNPNHLKTGSDGFIEFTNQQVHVQSKIAQANRSLTRDVGIQDSFKVDATPTDSTIVAFDAVPNEFLTKVGYQLPKLGSQVSIRQIFTDGQHIFTNFEYPNTLTSQLQDSFSRLSNVSYIEVNPCRGPEDVPNDPYFHSKASWKQNFDDQWAIKRVGYTSEQDSPWNIKLKKNPVVVAVVDSGLDWNHQDISWDNIWSNSKEIPENGRDDDKNGYVDDFIGWDFYQRTTTPWDHNGHGTFVTGIIAATPGNKEGIAGINPNAKIMVLKALNGLGHSRASYIAEAIIYAANNGARVINLSVGGYELTKTEQLAVDFARSKGSVIVVAAGNKAVDISKYSPAGLRDVLTVAASDVQDQRAVYSNFGEIDLAAPGNDVLSLRARRTDLLLDIPGVQYTAGTSYVGVDKRYYRASGSSFSAPIVSGTAALLFSIYPELTNEEVERMLVQSARDADVPGKDKHTGYGILDARAALKADRKFFLNAEINNVQVVSKEGKQLVQVSGTAYADQFKNAHLEIGMTKKPTSWKKVSADLKQSVRNKVLGFIPPTELAGSAEWTVRLVLEHQNGKTREGWFYLKLN